MCAWRSIRRKCSTGRRMRPTLVSTPRGATTTSLDASGKRRSGVLEQSWRMGGASSAEVAALQSFINDPQMRAIRVSSVETYIDQALPADAIEVYRGPAHNSDFLLKYVTVQSYDG
jgi:hypothetical protein